MVVADVADGAARKRRKKASYLGVPLAYKVELACQHLFRAFGEVCYHVGSSLERPDWRDVDLVMIFRDDDFRAMFPDCGPLEHARWEFDAKWLLMSVMVSDWLTHQCGAPIDFKFQPMTWANERHKGPRHAKGLVFPSDEGGPQ